MEPTFYATYFQHEDTHWWFRWRYELISRIVGDLNGGDPGAFRILDAGCGTGQMLQHLGRFGQAVGIDTSPEAIRFAATRTVEQLVLGSILDLPFADGTFDCVLSLDVIEHVDHDVDLLCHLTRVLKPGGHLVLTVPAFPALWSEHDEVNWHKRRYRAPQLRSLLAAQGLEIERLTYCNTALLPPIFAVRKLKNLRNRVRDRARARARANGHAAPAGLPVPESDLGWMPRPLNEGLLRLLRAENRLLERVDFPFGVSLLAIARKPERVERTATSAIPKAAPVTNPARELVGTGA
jgi:SAM-dependent methyltransferase